MLSSKITASFSLGILVELGLFCLLESTSCVCLVVRASLILMQWFWNSIPLSFISSLCMCWGTFSVGTMQLTLSVAIMQVTTSVAIMQVLRLYLSHAGGTLCYSYVGGFFCCNHAGLIQMKVSAANTEIDELRARWRACAQRAHKEIFACTILRVRKSIKAPFKLYSDVI